MKFSGTIIGLLEVLGFLYISHTFKTYYPNLNNINYISYYWLCFTVLTGLWEYTFIKNRRYIRRLAFKFIHKKQHVWTNKYSLKTLIPWNLSKQFYAEYGAYADREYMTIKDNWSYIIESSHSLICGSFALVSLVLLAFGHKLYDVSISVSMASQLMNSILYMGEYFIQINQVYSVNLNTNKFPCGFALTKRPFMYVNVFWTLMPIYVILNCY